MPKRIQEFQLRERFLRCKGRKPTSSCR